MFTANYNSSTRRYLSVAVYAVFFIVHLFCIPGPSNATMMPASVFGIQKINNKDKSIEDNADAGDVNKIKLNISKRFQHAEGWRRHLHLGFAEREIDPLQDLDRNYLINSAYEEALHRGD